MNSKFIASAEFLKTYEWRKLRQQVLTNYGNKCMCCGATSDGETYICVDHIKPRKTHPELALDITNLQVLCNVCNHGKGNWSSKDWRTKEDAAEFVITADWLRRYTKGGTGITKAKAKIVGMKYPLAKGWFKKIVGMVISDAKRIEFENSDTDKVDMKTKTAKTKELKRVESKLAEIMQQLKRLEGGA